MKTTFKQFLESKISDFDAFKKKKDIEKLDKKLDKAQQQSEKDFIIISDFMAATPKRYPELKKFVVFYMQKYKSADWDTGNYLILDTVYEMLDKIDKSKVYAKRVKSDEYEFSAATKALIKFLQDDYEPFRGKLEFDVNVAEQIMKNNDQYEIHSLTGLTERYIWTLNHLIGLLDTRLDDIAEKIK